MFFSVLKSVPQGKISTLQNFCAPDENGFRSGVCEGSIEVKCHDSRKPFQTSPKLVGVVVLKQANKKQQT